MRLSPARADDRPSAGPGVDRRGRGAQRVAGVPRRVGGAGWRTGRLLAVALAGWGATTVIARRGDRVAGATAVLMGFVGLVTGIGIGVRHLAAGDVSPPALAGTAALLAGAVVFGVGAWRLLAALRPLRRALAGLAGVAVTVVLLLTFVPAVMATNVPELPLGSRTPADVGLPFEEVAFRTEDGVVLAGWYVPSEQGAAVVLRHGAGSTRDDELDHAAVLARRGFGVLLTDARGHGGSGGRAMDFGWYGDPDVLAAVAFLATRPDVDPERIGVVGMSMGGEEAIGAAAADPRIRAVVAEGATARTAEDEDWLSERYGVRGWFQEQLERAQDVLTDLLTEASPPRSLREGVAASGATRLLVIAAGTIEAEQETAAVLAEAGGDRVETWVVPGAGHTGGLDTAPIEWERRVVGFLTDALARG